MISRITLLRGIGRFQDCTNLGGKNFNKNTIIFGPNAGGKSTLTDILWSFKTGNPMLIEGRKSFGFNGQQEIEFIDDNKQTYKFPSADWLKGSDTIEIFDTQFINENIFEGNEISFSHQKNLHSIIIGPKGNQLTKQINDLQDQFTELTGKKTSKTNEFNRIFKKEISPDVFHKLPRIEDPDSKIKEKKNLIETFNNQAKIINAFKTIDLQLTSVIEQSTKSILEKSMQVNAEKITEHILKTWKNPNHSKDFLQTGLILTKDDQKFCVFCGQEMSSEAKQLLTEYSKQFSAEYRDFQAKVIESATRFIKWEPVTYMESIKDKLASVKIHINLDSIDTELIKSLKTSIDEEFEKKIKDLDYRLDFNAFDSLLKIFIQIQDQVSTLKDTHVIKSELKVESIDREIKQIEYSKTRHTKEWEDFFKEYEAIDSIQDNIKRQREELRKQLNDYSEHIFKIHLDSINRILQELGADFLICDFQPIKKLVGQAERVFALKFFNTHRVTIDEKATNKPNFKNTLSESDKRVLAFAFFYSLMIHDPNINTKIVVFDDPFSSFDSDRRTKTAELLANPHYIDEDGVIIEKKIDQLIVLTHESEFFKWIFKKLDNPKALRIVPNGHVNGVSKSTIVDCDVMKEFIEDENIVNLKEIEKVRTSDKPVENFEGLCVKCRIILESVFKRKYLFDLEQEISANKSIRTFIDKLHDSAINNFDQPVKYKKFKSLCDNLNIELHDNSFKYDGKNAVTILNDFMTLIKEI